MIAEVRDAEDYTEDADSGEEELGDDLDGFIDEEESDFALDTVGWHNKAILRDKEVLPPTRGRKARFNVKDLDL